MPTAETCVIGVMTPCPVAAQLARQGLRVITVKRGDVRVEQRLIPMQEDHRETQ